MFNSETVDIMKGLSPREQRRQRNANTMGMIFRKMVFFAGLMLIGYAIYSGIVLETVLDSVPIQAEAASKVMSLNLSELIQMTSDETLKMSFENVLSLRIAIAKYIIGGALIMYLSRYVQWIVARIYVEFSMLRDELI